MLCRNVNALVLITTYFVSTELLFGFFLGNCKSVPNLKFLTVEIVDGNAEIPYLIYDYFYAKAILQDQNFVFFFSIIVFTFLKINLGVT
jgi:hypothetical protein